MLTLMIADESDIVRKVAKRILSAMDFSVVEAASTNDALGKCVHGLPDVIIVDGGMEGVHDLIAYIRAMPGGDRTRIFYCVIETDLKTMMTGRRAGADDFLQKPFDREALTMKLGPLVKAA